MTPAEVIAMRDRLAAKVYEHTLEQLLLGNGRNDHWFTAACACGWRSDEYEMPGDAHDVHSEHVATHLLTEINPGWVVAPPKNEGENNDQDGWQYGLQDSDGFVSFRNLSLKSLRKRAKQTGEVIVRRRKAGPWIPLEGESKS